MRLRVKNCARITSVPLTWETKRIIMPLDKKTTETGVTFDASMQEGTLV